MFVEALKIPEQVFPKYRQSMTGPRDIEKRKITKNGMKKE
tara:strand:- start:254 stop:373 length:120 start_codon:yes stop_codon:yes gene_type:complete